MGNRNKELYTVRLIIETNLLPETDIRLGDWYFVKEVIRQPDPLPGITAEETILRAVTQIESPEASNRGVESQALDAIEGPLTALAFCLDGVFRANPHRMDVESSKGKSQRLMFFEDWRHPTFGRAFTKEECKFVEKISETIRKDESLKWLLHYYNLGLSLSHGFYYLSEAFLNFYKVIETVSWAICDKYQAELRDRKEQELNSIADKILNERRLDDSRHNREVKINRIRNLIGKYIAQKEMTAKDQVEFTCIKLSLVEDTETAKRLIEVRNQGGIAHSSKGQNEYQWLEELRQCRDLARKYILRYLILEGVLDSESYPELMQVPSGIH